MAEDHQPDSTPNRGPTTGLLVLLFGVAQVAILFGLLVVDNPLGSWARRQADTWPGRILLAAIGWGVISASMIVLLTIAERRSVRGKRESAD